MFFICLYLIGAGKGGTGVSLLVASPDTFKINHDVCNWGRKQSPKQDQIRQTCLWRKEHNYLCIICLTQNYSLFINTNGDIFAIEPKPSNPKAASLIFGKTIRKHSHINTTHNKWNHPESQRCSTEFKKQQPTANANLYFGTRHIRYVSLHKRETCDLKSGQGEDEVVVECRSTWMQLSTFTKMWEKISKPTSFWQTDHILGMVTFSPEKFLEI